MSGEPLGTAIEALDRALAARPKRDGQAFSDATKAVCAYRDTLRRAVRETPDAPEPRRRLKEANVAVTLLLAGHFPLGEAPWPQIDALRSRLQATRRESAA